MAAGADQMRQRQRTFGQGRQLTPLELYADAQPSRAFDVAAEQQLGAMPTGQRQQPGGQFAHEFARPQRQPQLHQLPAALDRLADALEPEAALLRPRIGRGDRVTGRQSQRLQDPAIGRSQDGRIDLLRRQPLQPLPLQRLRLALPLVGLPGIQQQLALGVMNGHPDQRFATQQGDAHFLAQFARQCRHRRLARFELAARELPHARQVLAGRPLRQQHAPQGIEHDRGHHVHDRLGLGRCGHQLLRRYSTMSKS